MSFQQCLDFKIGDTVPGGIDLAIGLLDLACNLLGYEQIVRLQKAKVMENSV